MKKILLSLILVSVFMVGCSNINTNIKDSCEDLVKNFFDSMNSIEDYTNESELAKLNEYFTDDSDVKDKLIHSDMYLYIKDEDGQLKIKTADYGG